MKKIYIEGNFIIKGDIPTLDMLQQPMSTAYIEVEEHCPIKLVQFECPKENLTKHNKDLTKICFNYACENLDKSKDRCKRDKVCDMQIRKSSLGS